ncbi:hypothetical protein HU200_019662 [Digitaria exilis]|uniref:Uncharacterized protein n=1 Tax=Digitaria exilis TaxID=1010633 RepID=A0A835F2N0_9POAL|nr:hypothetical protein HU200_019662 [Digitaria exilis]
MTIKLLRGCGMILVNTFEYPFGDVYPKGDTRIFACTGVFIDFDDKYPKILTSASLVRDPGDPNKIIVDLRIEVLLPGKRCEIGTLKLHSLHYNVALVSVDNYRPLCPVNLEEH